MNKQLKAFLLAPLASIPTAVHFGIDAQIADKYAETIYETFIVVFLGIPLLAYFLTLLFFPVHLLYKKLKMQSALAYVLPPVILSAAAFIFIVFNGAKFDANFAFIVFLIVFTCGLVSWVFWLIAVKSETIPTSTNKSSDAQPITKKSSKFGMVALSAAAMLMYGGYWFNQLQIFETELFGSGVSSKHKDEVETVDTHTDEELKALKEELDALEMAMAVAKCMGIGQSDFQEVYAACRKHAELGALDAQKRLAQFYRIGFGTEINMEQYFYWAQKAADQGDAEYQNLVGMAFWNGNVVTEDLAQANDWFRKAAEQGYASAQVNLASSYEYGVGIEKNLQQAFKWYLMAAEQDHASAQGHVASLYWFGRGVGMDKQQALIWYKKAAENGDIEAQVNLGIIYYNGSIVNKNTELGVEWLKKAAEQGSERAKETLEKIGR